MNAGNRKRKVSNADVIAEDKRRRRDALKVAEAQAKCINKDAFGHYPADRNQNRSASREVFQSSHDLRSFKPGV